MGRISPVILAALVVVVMMAVAECGISTSPLKLGTKLMKQERRNKRRVSGYDGPTLRDFSRFKRRVGKQGGEQKTLDKKGLKKQKKLQKRESGQKGLFRKRFGQLFKGGAGGKPAAAAAAAA